MRINDVVDKVYCINLSRRPDRWINVEKEFKNNHIVAERFEAIDGGTVDSYPMLSRGAAGCLLSHLSIINDAIDNSYESIAIFEDDVFFVENFSEKFSEFYSQVPEDWQFAYLANNKVQAQVSRVSENVERVSNAWSTHAFLIRSAAMELTTHLAKEGNYPIDVCYGKIQEFVPAYTAVPSLAGQRADYSDIENLFIDYNIIYGL